MIMKCPNCKHPDFETMIQKCWCCGAEINKVFKVPRLELIK